jgi:hypothetical protein
MRAYPKKIELADGSTALSLIILESPEVTNVGRNM